MCVRPDRMGDRVCPSAPPPKAKAAGGRRRTAAAAAAASAAGRRWRTTLRTRRRPWGALGRRRTRTRRTVSAAGLGAACRSWTGRRVVRSACQLQQRGGEEGRWIVVRASLLVPQRSTRPSSASTRGRCCRRPDASTPLRWTPGSASRCGPRVVSPRQRPEIARSCGLPQRPGGPPAPAADAGHASAAASHARWGLSWVRAQVITKLLYLLSQGESFTKARASSSGAPGSQMERCRSTGAAAGARRGRSLRPKSARKRSPAATQAQTTLRPRWS